MQPHSPFVPILAFNSEFHAPSSALGGMGLGGERVGQILHFAFFILHFSFGVVGLEGGSVPLAPASVALRATGWLWPSAILSLLFVRPAASLAVLRYPLSSW